MKRFGLGAALLALLAGCAGELRSGGNIGGANANVKRPGNVPGGIAVRNGDIAVSPRNSFFVTLRDGMLVLGDMARQNATPMRNLPKPNRLAFWPGDKDGVVILSQAQGALGAPTGKQQVVSFDRSTGEVRWQKEMDRKDKRLDITQDGTRVILAGNDVLILDAATGEEVGRHSTDVAIRDVDLVAGGTRMVVIEETRWEGAEPLTRMSVRNTNDGSEVCHVDANNCADDATISQDETRVFLAPTLCQKDPVTVMNVQGGTCTVEKQMPGFGPAAESPDGRTMVAFLDRDEQAPLGTVVPDHVKNSRQKYHLMLIDQATLEYTTVPVGDELPRYAFTPDGKRLLVDSPMDVFSKVRVLDLESGTLTTVSGPPVKLNSFTLSPDSLRAYVADGQLFDLDIAAAKIRPVGLGVPPDSVNLSMDGVTLLVTQISDRVLVFMDAARVQETNRVFY